MPYTEITDEEWFVVEEVLEKRIENSLWQRRFGARFTPLKTRPTPLNVIPASLDNTDFTAGEDKTVNQAGEELFGGPIFYGWAWGFDISKEDQKSVDDAIREYVDLFSIELVVGNCVTSDDIIPITAYIPGMSLTQLTEQEYRDVEDAWIYQMGQNAFNSIATSGYYFMEDRYRIPVIGVLNEACFLTVDADYRYDVHNLKELSFEAMKKDQENISDQARKEYNEKLPSILQWLLGKGTFDKDKQAQIDARLRDYS